jgi:hypothetical protein
VKSSRVPWPERDAARTLATVPRLARDARANILSALPATQAPTHVPEDVRPPEAVEYPRAFAGRLTSAARAHPLIASAIGLGVAARIAFWAATDRRFEDGLITIAHARSVVEGIGLTHHPGEPPTHGFTSALSVLVPLVGELVGQVLGPVDGFAFVRAASLVAFVAAALFVVRICGDLGLDRWPTFFVVAYLAMGQNQIFYGMSGMETQIAVAVLLGGTHFVMRRRFMAAGACLGLAVLARPDFVLWAAPAFLALLVWDRREAMRAGLLGAAVVAPWAIFTTAYYGSPIPNTVHAKALRYPTDLPGLAWPWTWASIVWSKIEAAGTHFWHTFTPLLENGFVVMTPIPQFAHASIAFSFMVLALVGAYSTRKVGGWWVALAYLGVFVIYRFLFLPEGYYEWYYVPFMALVAVAAGAGLTTVSRSARRTGALLAIAMAVLFAVHLPYSMRLERSVQKDIEDRVRVPMSEWLGETVAAGERVTSESAGYVGFYGRVLLWDYPGLTSKQTLAVMEELGTERNSMSELISAARPEWVVLRPHEYDALREHYPEIASKYIPARRFFVPYEETPLQIGRLAMVNIDRDFTVFRREDVPPR